MNREELLNLLKTVRQNIRCPQCGKQYGFADIRIRSVAEFVVFLELSCSDHMPVLATVALGKDLTKKEKTKVEVVTGNDIIKTYEFLKDFTGGFQKIFNKKIK